MRRPQGYDLTMSKRHDDPIRLPGDFEERLADLLAVDPSGLHDDDQDDETQDDDDQATADSDGSE